MNKDLNKQVFAAVQRGHRLASKLGYADLDEAEAALATQAEDPVLQESQRMELVCQHPADELATYVQELQTELTGHVKLSKDAVRALGEAMEEIARLKEENEELSAGLERDRVKAEEADTKRAPAMDEAKPQKLPEVDFDELAFARAELSALKEKYSDLRRVKEDADKKHSEDYRRWKAFKKWLFDEVSKEQEHPAKRRKLNPPGEDKAKESEEDSGDDDLLSGKPPKKSKQLARIRKRVSGRGPRTLATPARVVPTGEHNICSDPLPLPTPYPTSLSSRIVSRKACSIGFSKRQFRPRFIVVFCYIHPVETWQDFIFDHHYLFGGARVVTQDCQTAPQP